MLKLRNIIKFIAVTALFICGSTLFLSQTHAQTAPVVKVEGAWVRTAVEGQQGTGGFLKLTASQDMTLVGISSPVAGVGEVHEMKMEGDVMKMRALPAGLALPAGKTIELKPGGLHLMLLDLKQALPKDTTVPVTLVFKDQAGKEQKQLVNMPVSARAPLAAASAAKP
jgi:periplasmic copper chaperone A